MSAAARPRSSAFSAVPAELVSLPQWLVWGLEIVVDPTSGKERETKVPYQARTPDRKASSTDPATWARFDEAIANVEAGRAEGIGFVFTDGDPFAGVDLDKCRDPKTGAIEAWAAAIINCLDSYSEVSPSGRGVHIIVEGSVPAGGNRRGSVEMYSSARFFTMTGQRLQGALAAVEPRQAELEAVHREHVARPVDEPAGDNGRARRPVSDDDEELLQRARRGRSGDAFARLWDGDTTGYSSPSEADLALCSHLAYWTGGDAPRIDRLFCSSGLMREKWTRAGYRHATIATACGERVRGAAATATAVPGQGAGDNGSPPPSGDAAEFPPAAPAERHGLTDLGNGRRMAARHGTDMRYCHPWREWLMWDGRRWQRDDTAEAHRRAKDTALAIFDEAREERDADRQKALAKWAGASQASARLEAMLTCAASEPGIPVRPPELDAQSWLLNVENGTVDLRTGTLRRHRHEDMLTKLAGAAFHPEAPAPLWRACLERWLPDSDVRAFVQRAAGYSATGGTGAQVLFFLHGGGSNGKSVLVRALLEVLGDYAMQGAPELLMAKAPGQVPTDVADLQGRRLVATIEVEDGRRLAEVLVKQLTGGDRVTARRMRQDFFSFEPTHKLWLVANHRPVIRGTDHAIWRRILMVPFEVTIPEAEQDPKLVERLVAERDGILAWIVEGALIWQREGLEPPAAVRAATAAYRSAMDVLGSFLEDECVVAPEAQVAATDLWAAYQRWAARTGETGGAGSQRALGLALQERGFTVKRGTGGRRMWRGLRLASEPTLDEDGVNVSDASDQKP